MSQIKDLAKAYVQTRSGTPDRSSSSSQQHQSNSQSSGTKLRLDFQQGKQRMSKSSQRALRDTELNMTGLSQRTRSNREGRINELAAQHGSNVIDLVTFVRSLIPWTCLCRPGMKSQVDYNHTVEQWLTGSTFRKDGFILSSDWAEVCGANKKKGKAGSISNNNWKSYTETAVSVFIYLQEELVSPSWLGTGMYSQFSLCCHGPTASSPLYKEDRSEAKRGVFQVMSIQGYDNEEGKIIFRMAKPEYTFFDDYLDLISEITDGHISADSPDLHNNDHFSVSEIDFDKDLIFSEEKSNLLDKLKHHPIYLYFGLMNSLNSKFGPKNKNEERLFYNIQDVTDTKLLKYALNPNMETHLLFLILYNMFCPYQQVDSFGTLYSIYNVQYETMLGQCRELIIRSRMNWFNSKNVKIIQVALRIFSLFPGPSTSRTSAAADDSQKNTTPSNLCMEVFSTDEEDEGLRQHLEDDLRNDLSGGDEEMLLGEDGSEKDPSIEDEDEKLSERDLEDEDEDSPDDEDKEEEEEEEDLSLKVNKKRPRPSAKSPSPKKPSPKKTPKQQTPTPKKLKTADVVPTRRGGRRPLKK